VIGLLKKYVVNKDLKKEFKKTTYKKNPEWAKRKKTRVILYSLMVLLPIIVFLSLYRNSDFVLFVIDSEKVTESDQLISAGFLSLSTFVMFWTFAVYYYRKTKRNCSGALHYMQYEALALDDEGINLSQHQKESLHYQSAYVQSIDYEDITKLVFNKYYNTLEVYGKITEAYYYDIRILDPAYTEVYEAKEGKGLIFYLYYDDSEDFVNEVVERSNKELIVVNDPVMRD
jgi:hypothetical protein